MIHNDTRHLTRHEHHGCNSELGSFGAQNLTILWTSYLLQYSSMVAACFFLWRGSFFGFLAFFLGAYVPSTLLLKWDRPTQRFKDECQASAPRYADALFKSALYLFAAVFFLRGTLGSYAFRSLLGAYAFFVLTCALRDSYLVRYCISHWHERHR